MSASEYGKVIQSLRRVQARVIVLFVGETHAQIIISHPKMQSGPKGEFIFLGSDSMEPTVHGPIYEGSLSIVFPYVTYPPFDTHLKNMNALNSRGNTWFMDIWRRMHDCVYVDDDSVVPNTTINCKNIEHLPLPRVRESRWVSSTLDSFNVIVKALDNLIRDKCPEAYRLPDLARNCTKGEDLLEYIRNTTLKGKNTKNCKVNNVVSTW